MPTTLTDPNVPQRITLADTNNTCLTLPTGTLWLRIRPITSEAFIEIGGTDEGARGTHYETYTADVTEYRAVSMHGNGTVCLSGTMSAVVEITPIEKAP